ncbi:hypothetical protein P171DRAFT_446407 [Karstenula rhodostoma CBS 690.94]|uniref:Uncharacterized protein n=1 Tax=Karstenula rhodostoma CBS 690.94 TaxID=1392251 RepID=A0A9P4PAP5_9PLEO|nr:hypothetical protein P171DRAFT_446407 [Karstenula rhodostoma CBS 690.94]
MATREDLPDVHGHSPRDLSPIDGLSSNVRSTGVGPGGVDSCRCHCWPLLGHLTTCSAKVLQRHGVDSRRCHCWFFVGHLTRVINYPNHLSSESRPNCAHRRVFWGNNRCLSMKFSLQLRAKRPVGNKAGATPTPTPIALKPARRTQHSCVSYYKKQNSTKYCSWWCTCKFFHRLNAANSTDIEAHGWLATNSFLARKIAGQGHRPEGREVGRRWAGADTAMEMTARGPTKPTKLAAVGVNSVADDRPRFKKTNMEDLSDVGDNVLLQPDLFSPRSPSPIRAYMDGEKTDEDIDLEQSNETHGWGGSIPRFNTEALSRRHSIAHYGSNLASTFSQPSLGNM